MDNQNLPIQNIVVESRRTHSLFSWLIFTFATLFVFPFLLLSFAAAEVLWFGLGSLISGVVIFFWIYYTSVFLAKTIFKIDEVTRKGRAIFALISFFLAISINSHFFGPFLFVYKAVHDRTSPIVKIVSLNDSYQAKVAEPFLIRWKSIRHISPDANVSFSLSQKGFQPSFIRTIETNPGEYNLNLDDVTLVPGEYFLTVSTFDERAFGPRNLPGWQSARDQIKISVLNDLSAVNEEKNKELKILLASLRQEILKTAQEPVETSYGVFSGGFTSLCKKIGYDSFIDTNTFPNLKPGIKAILQLKSVAGEVNLGAQKQAGIKCLAQNWFAVSVSALPTYDWREKQDGYLDVCTDFTGTDFGGANNDKSLYNRKAACLR